LPHPIRMYEGTYSNATLGEMVWTVSGDALEVRMGVAAGRAEVLDASANKLRIEIAGGGEVVEFQFAADGGAATLLRYDGQSFVRREGARPR
ncbi:MAG: hypothetical protein ABIZ91_09510, partial [Gemmatimonadaceae bacterium]